MSILSIIFSIFFFIYILSCWSGGPIDMDVLIMLSVLFSIFNFASSIVSLNYFKTKEKKD